MAYEIHGEKCTSCGSCAEECPEGAIAFAAAAGVYRIDAEKCIDCGVCETTCPSGAPRPRS